MRPNEKKISVEITPAQKELLDTFTNQDAADILYITKGLTAFSLSRFRSGDEITTDEITGLAYLKDFISLLHDCAANEMKTIPSHFYVAI